MFNASSVAEAVSTIVHSIPGVATDPYTHTALGISPSPVEMDYPLFNYWIVLATVGPSVYILYCYYTSLYSGEWTNPDFKTFKREATIAVKSLVLTSPVLAYAFKAMFEGRFGKLYYKEDPNCHYGGIYTYLVAPVLFWIASDATFYFGHRFWHIKWLYEHSHYWHHSCRPTTSFAGNAGYASAIVPTLLVPMDAQIFLGVTAFSHWWTIYLHNNAAHLLPPWLGLDFVYTSHDHNIHHYYGQKNYNFGLYFRFWDRLLGTYKETVPTCARLSRSNAKVQPRKKPQFQN